MTTEGRKRSEDVYELLQEFGSRLDKVTAVMVSVGGEDQIKQRVQEHEQLMIDVPEIRATQRRVEVTIDVLADHVVGPKIPNPLNPDEWLVNGRGEPMRKPKPRWPRWVGQALIQTVTLVTALLILLNTLA